MVLISLGAIITALLGISVLAYMLFPTCSTSGDEATIAWWGFFNTVFVAMLAAAWMQYAMNRHWENYLASHQRGEFVQKKGANGPYLEFQLVPPLPLIPPTEEPLTLVNPEAKQ